MPALSFQKRFAAAVENGEKRQTFRKRRKRPIRAGDTLCMFTGMRTKQCRRLRTEICTKITPVEITFLGTLVLAGVTQTAREAQRFARADGFEDYGEMLKWVVRTHGLPFVGDVIYWGLQA